MIVVPPAARREVLELPEPVREALADALARLDAGHALRMPLARSMPAIGAGVHELRLRDRSGSYRVVYLARRGNVYVLHAFPKKTQSAPKRSIDLARARLKEVLR